MSLLSQAVQGQHERCVNILLENHADPNLVDINGNTALHLTANIPSLSTAVLLLEHEADINAQNQVILSGCVLQSGLDYGTIALKSRIRHLKLEVVM